MKNFMRNTGLALLSAMMLSSCFDLKEEVYSEIPMDNFGKTEQELIATAGRAYTQLQNYCTEQSLWTLSLQVADECAVPINSNGSWAEERYGELQRQQYTPSNTLVLKGWNFCFDGIASCNEILYELGLSTAEFEAKEKITAEVEVLRAFFYFMAIDGWGNVPYSIDYTDTSYPEQKDRKFLFSFIEKSIKDNLPLLDAEPSTSTYGRVTQDVAYTLLAKLYLNAEVGRGRGGMLQRDFEGSLLDCRRLCVELLGQQRGFGREYLRHPLQHDLHRVGPQLLHYLHHGARQLGHREVQHSGQRLGRFRLPARLLPEVRCGRQAS